MKKQAKDPRPRIIFFLRISLITLFFVPFFYINIKSNKPINLLLFLGGYILIFWFMEKYYKVNDELKLHRGILTGYAFSATWFFCALITIFAFITDLNNVSISLKVIEFSVASIFLFFGVVLFYFSYKSKKFEELRNRK